MPAIRKPYAPMLSSPGFGCVNNSICLLPELRCVLQLLAINESCDLWERRCFRYGPHHFRVPSTALAQRDRNDLCCVSPCLNHIGTKDLGVIGELIERTES